MHYHVYKTRLHQCISVSGAVAPDYESDFGLGCNNCGFRLGLGGIDSLDVPFLCRWYIYSAQILAIIMSAIILWRSIVHIMHLFLVRLHRIMIRILVWVIIIAVSASV